MFAVKYKIAQYVRVPGWWAKHNGFESRFGQECFILYFSLSSRGKQLESVNTYEINRAIHLAYTLF